MSDPANPLIVQSDLTVLLEVAAERTPEVRPLLARFAELDKAPEHIHSYRITPLSLWNAAVAGLTEEDVVATLTDFAKYPVPGVVVREVSDVMARYGRVWLARIDSGLVLAADDDLILDELASVRSVAELLGQRLDRHRFAVADRDRGVLKQALLAAGWPAADEAGFESGAALGPMVVTAELRPYQRDAVTAWWRGGDPSGGSGVVVLPCGAGKTVVGLAVVAATSAHTLVVCTSISSIRQWIRETIDKTTLTADDLGEWSGEIKQLRPVTFVTYHSLTWADPLAAADADVFTRHPHLELFNQVGWGLVVYDEVHLLPAPVFRAAARVQAIRRLGLTATLVREDGREGDIFSLIGPKRFDAPWSEFESAGWIATATCTEVRVALGNERRAEYSSSEPKLRHRIAATATEKIAVVDSLIAAHPDEQILVIGQFVEQLRDIAARIGAPLLTGQTPQATRERLFAQLRAGEIRVLVVSKIANFSIDLPEVSVAIQVSGQFGSRQEEAQRLGRILRPKANGGAASFYSVIADETDEVRFARNRQRFLAEQGYTYSIIDAAVDGSLPAR